jgi:quercetin dioxygenase-like cupin family protein
MQHVFPDAFAKAPAHVWGGSTYRTLIDASATAGALSLLLIEEPAQWGPPRHVHAREDEAFHILSGEIEFWVAGTTIRRGPGGSAFVPRGTEHAFRTLSPVTMLVALTPGGFEGFFAEMAAGAFRIPEDMGPIGESAARHRMVFTGPPL